jgi:hypothetical protein
MSDTLTYEPITKKETKSEPDKEINVFIPKKVQAKKNIPTLFITDLPFTADKLINCDAPIIGYKGISDQYSDNLRILHPELIDIIGRKNVKNVVLLYNSDCMDPKFKPGSDNDLSKPLFNIYYAVKNFRDLLSDYDNEMVLWFAHTKHHFFKDNIITLDHLATDQKAKTVAEQLKKFKNKTNPYFEKINISEFSLNRLYSHLKLKDVTSFYAYHSEVLSYSEFVFRHVRYCHDGDKLEKIQHTDSKLYLRAGARYYKRLMIPNSHGEYEEQLKPWIIGEITRDYGQAFFDQISKYDSFVNKPCNTGEYQRVITTNHNGLSSDLYNIYNPVDWDPKEGQWTNIKSFLEHIFESCNLDGEILYQFGLDWIQHCYIRPIQRLPALCLVSKEKNTGKSTFLDFLKMIFQSNMTILDNERFRSQFTSHYAGKLIIGLDEGYIPVHDKLMKERIKNMIIGKVQWLEGKGTNAESVDNFAKMVMCSNDENNFMQIDKDENRFAVLKIRTFKECGIKDDPDLMDKMRKEIPAFLNYLLNRKLHYPEKATRFWFPDQVYTTAALKVVIDKTKSRLAMELEEFLQDQFIIFQKADLEFQLKDLVEQLNSDTNYTFDKSRIKNYLQEERKIFPSNKVKHYKLYEFSSTNDTGITEITSKGRVYTFCYKDWLTEDQIKEIKPL